MTNREKLLDLIKNSDEEGINKIKEKIFGIEDEKKEITIDEDAFSKKACECVKHLIIKDPKMILVMDELITVVALLHVKLFNNEEGK